MTNIFQGIIGFYIIIINIIAKVSSRIPEKASLLLLRLTVFLITVVTIWRWMNVEIHNHSLWEYEHIIYISLFIILLVTSIKSTCSKHDVTWNPSFWIGWYLCFLLIFLGSFHNSVTEDYFVWSVFSLFYFPAFVIIWQVRDEYDDLFCTIAWSTVICSYIFLVVSILGAFVFRYPEYPDLFFGAVGNPNANGMVSTGFFAAAIYLVFNDERNNGWALFSCAISIALATVSSCRTTQLAIGIIIIFSYLYYFKKGKEKKCINKATKKLASTSIIIIALTIPLYLILKLVSSAELFAYAMSSNAGKPNAYDVINSFSSGRLDLWKYFTQDITLFGHGKPDVTGLPIVFNWAHNNLLDILFISGLFAAIGYLIWVCYCLFFVVRCFKMPYQHKHLFVIVSIIGYFVEAMLEITIYPMNTGIVFMLYMGLPIISGRSNKAYDSST